MGRSAKVRKIFVSYFGGHLSLHVQSFNLLGFAGSAAGIIAAVVTAAQHAGLFSVILNLTPSVLGITLLRTAGKKISYRAASRIVVAAVFIVAFPALFFAIGGYRSGMPSFFIFAIIFTAIMLEKHERLLALAAEFTIYVCCCLVAYFYPRTVTAFDAEIYYVSDVITGIVVAGSLLLLVVLLHIRMYHIRELQIKELNRELEARNVTLVKYDKMKSDFLATVAHEISKPLTVIVSSSADTMALLKETPVNMEEISQNHERIEKKVFLIDGIVTDLMDTVAIESGRLPLSRQLVKLSELVKNVCETGNYAINGNRITYEFEGKLPFLWADPVRIEQVMTNLLGNATRHTRNGTITVRLTRTENSQTVSVIDNGEGMDPEIAASVLKGTVVSGEHGEYWRHGFGLYICRQIVKSHGGEIWVESERGRGTTVTFTLPESED